MTDWPKPPVEPDPQECCGRGCCPCIFDYYTDALERWSAFQERALAVVSDPTVVPTQRAEKLKLLGVASSGAAPLMPIPTQLVSNGEYPPQPQTPHQRRVESRVNDLADIAAQKLACIQLQGPEAD